MAVNNVISAFNSVGHYIGPVARKPIQNIKSENLKYVYPDTTPTIGKHKIKRFLYHLTNKENYESMLRDGQINVAEEMCPGVFMVELPNLFKRWGRHKSWFGELLKASLLQQAAKGSDDLVVLRIPTGNIDKSKLVVRGQEKLFSSYDKLEAYDKADLSEGAIELIKLKFKELFQGIPAKDSSLLKKRKKSIEYIYKDSIPMDKVEKAGEVNVAELRKTREYDPLRPMRSIFTALFKGQPEEKGAALLKD